MTTIALKTSKKYKINVRCSLLIKATVIAWNENTKIVYNSK